MDAHTARIRSCDTNTLAIIGNLFRIDRMFSMPPIIAWSVGIARSFLQKFLLLLNAVEFTAAGRAFVMPHRQIPGAIDGHFSPLASRAFEFDISNHYLVIFVPSARPSGQVQIG